MPSLTEQEVELTIADGYLETIVLLFGCALVNNYGRFTNCFTAEDWKARDPYYRGRTVRRSTVLYRSVFSRNETHPGNRPRRRRPAGSPRRRNFRACSATARRSGRLWRRRRRSPCASWPNSLITERRNRLSSHSRSPLNEPVCGGEGYWEGKTFQEAKLLICLPIALLRNKTNFNRLFTLSGLRLAWDISIS